MTRLVLVHGRDLAARDPELLESQWLTALNAGFAAAGSTLRLDDDDASFVYYGDTLAHLTEPPGDRAGGEQPPITVHAQQVQVDEQRLAALGEDELQFLVDVVRDVLAGSGQTLPVVRAEGVLLDALVEALTAGLALLDRIPGVSTGVVLLIARDVYAYLHDDDVRATIDAGLRDALAGTSDDGPATDGPAVVVAHSLGSVIAYSVLRSALSSGPTSRATAGQDVPLLLTVGSPLGIRTIREAVQARGPLVFPPGVGRWVNAHDRRDVLSLHPLGPPWFALPAGSPAIEGLDVDNQAPGHHAAAAVTGPGIPVGYLALPEVAGPLATSLT